MAYLREPEEEEQQQGAQSPMQQQSATQAATIQQTAASAPTAPGQSPKGSGSFVNLQKYIEANKPKAQELTQKIQSGITGQAEKVKSGLQETREQTLGEGSQYAQEQQRLEEAKPFYEQTFQQAGTQPLKEEDIKRFQGLARGEQVKLAAPELQQQRASAADLERRAREFATSRGRMEELAKTVGRQSSGYSGGQKSLDELVLAGDRRGRQQALRNIRRATSGLGEQVSGLETEAQAKREALKNLAQQRSQEISQLLEQGATAGFEQELGGRGITDIESELQRRAEQATQAAPQEVEALRQRIQTGALTPEDIQILGLAPGQQTYGLDLSQYVSAVNRPASVGDVASQEELSRYQALQQLAGRQGGILAGYDQENIGGYSPYRFNQEAAQAELGRRSGEFSRLQNFRQELKGLEQQKAQELSDAYIQQARQMIADTEGTVHLRDPKAQARLLRDARERAIRDAAQWAQQYEAEQLPNYEAASYNMGIPMPGVEVPTGTTGGLGGKSGPITEIPGVPVVKK